MIRVAWLLAALPTVCATSGAWAQKEVRVALVIGNGAHQNAEPLRWRFWTIEPMTLYRGAES